MRACLEQGEWCFALVKGATLGAAWAAMAWYSRYNRPFVRSVCLWGSAAYLILWIGWFSAGTYL